MNADTETTLDAVHAAIVAAIAGQFPALATVEAYREDRRLPAPPACLVELSEMIPDPDIDPGTGQLAVVATFSARLIIHFKQPGLNPGLEIRKLAAALGTFVHKNRFGCPIGAATVTGIYADDFDPDLDQFEVWRVEWDATIHLGESVWKDSGGQPWLVFGAWEPRTGAAHEADYSLIVDGVPPPLVPVEPAP